MFIDLCFWCKKDQCRFAHTKAIRTYRRALHEKTVRRLIKDGLLPKNWSLYPTETYGPIKVGNVDDIGKSQLKPIWPKFKKWEWENIKNYKPKTWDRKESREERTLREYGY